MKSAFYLAVILSLLASCKTPSDFEGFKKSKKGFHYQLRSLGESNRKIVLGDYVTADIVYTTMNDSVFFKGRRKIKLEDPVYEGKEGEQGILHLAV